MRAYKIAKSVVGSHALPLTFAACLTSGFGGSIHAQQTADRELAVKVSYDRFENVTLYETSRMELEPQDKKEYGGTTLAMTAAFACRGDTEQQPCTPPQVSLRFSYVVWGEGSLGKSVEEYENAFNGRPLPKPPFNYAYRNVIAIADGANVPLGAMAVNHHFNPEMKATFWDGGLNLDLHTMRRLTAARDVEMRVGVMAVTLTHEQKVLLAGIFNLAVQSAYKPAPKPRSTRRPKRRL